MQINLYLWTLLRVVRLTLAMKICQKKLFSFFIYTDLWKTFESVEEPWKVLSTNLRLRFSCFCITEPLCLSTYGRLFRRWFSIKSSVFQRSLRSISRIVLHLASTKPES